VRMRNWVIRLMKSLILPSVPRWRWSLVLVVFVLVGSTVPVEATAERAAHHASPSHTRPIPTYTQDASPVVFSSNNQVPGVSYYVMTSPHVYLDFWGSQWNDQSTKDSGGFYTNFQARTVLTSFFQSLGGSPWTNTLTQFCQNVPVGTTSCSGNPNAVFITNPSSLVNDWWVDTVNAPPPQPPSYVNEVGARAEASNAYTRWHDPGGIYMIFTPSGVRWHWDIPLTPTPCAWHDVAPNSGGPYVTFGIVPYQPDGRLQQQYLNCSTEDVNPRNNDPGAYGDGWFDGLTMIAAHEYAEEVTDPFNGGWYDSTGNGDGEGPDKCGAGLNQFLYSPSRPVSYSVPLGNIWLGSHYYAVPSLWSNVDSACVFPVENTGHMYMLDGYGGIHPSGSAPTLASPDYLGYDIGRGLSFFGGASAGYWLDGHGHLHPIGNVRSPGSLAGVPSWGIDIGRAIWLAPWSTPSAPSGYILDGYGGITGFGYRGTTPGIASPHYTSGTDIARGVVINPDQKGTSPVSGYMLDGYGTLWPFGNSPYLSSPTFSTDIARGMTLLPKTTTAYPSGYILDGFGGLHPFGFAPTLTRYSYFGWDIARSVTSWTFAFTSWSYSQTSYVGGWVLDGYGGVHSYEAAPDISSNAYWQNWDIARGHAGSSSGSGAR